MNTMKSLTINGQMFRVIDEGAVRYDKPQELLPGERAQAQDNLGFGGVSETNPTKQLSVKHLVSAYKAAFYTSLPGAVAELNAGTIGTNADATADDAVCALYTDFDGNTCLTLLKDIDLNENVTILETVVLKVNGYTIHYTGDHVISLDVNSCVFDFRVDGSRLVKNVDDVTSSEAMVRIRGEECKLLKCSISYVAASAAKAVCAIASSAQSSMIDGCNVYLTVESNNQQTYALQISGYATVVNSSITANGADGPTYAIQLSDKSKGCHLNGCRLIANANQSAYVFSSLAPLGTDVLIENCEIKSENAVNAVRVAGELPVVIQNCKIETGSPAYSCQGVFVKSGATVRLVNTEIFVDGIHGGDETGVLPGQSIGVLNGGSAFIENCNIYATHSGIQCSENSTTVINGGLYESVGHGGVYLVNIDGHFYAQNATFKSSPYRGAYKDKYIYQQTDYINAAVYVGNKPNIKGYFDNCILDGSGPCVYVDSTSGEPLGGEPVRFKSGGTGNSIFASNCTFEGDGKIRFGGGSTQRLYLGFANRVLCEASIPSCVDSTTYAKKVFTSYE